MLLLAYACQGQKSLKFVLAQFRRGIECLGPQDCGLGSRPKARIEAPASLDTARGPLVIEPRLELGANNRAADRRCDNNRRSSRRLHPSIDGTPARRSQSSIGRGNTGMRIPETI